MAIKIGHDTMGGRPKNTKGLNVVSSCFISIQQKVAAILRPMALSTYSLGWVVFILTLCVLEGKEEATYAGTCVKAFDKNNAFVMTLFSQLV